ncbi:30S ribosomal protein S3 chloroplastic, partial [Bienertia sinuspersici]
LGTTQSHYSLWFSQAKNYSEGLQEDQKIRDCIKNYVQKNTKASSGVEGIAHIEIQKRIDLIQIIIHMGFRKLLIENRPQGIEDLKRNIQKELNCSIISKSNEKSYQLTGLAYTKGIQILVAGRIDGKEIARIERTREGRVPLQTIRAKIDYCAYTVRTINGVVGIKIWIFIDEE